MKLLFKQRLFSWFGRYDIYGENGETLFTVEGKPSWGHRLHVLDQAGEHIGTVKQKLASFMPRFELYAYGEYLGCIKQETALLTPRFTFDCSDWEIEGNWTCWDYTIVSPSQGVIAAMCKARFQMADVYAIEVPNPSDTLCVLLAALAVHAGKF